MGFVPGAQDDSSVIDRLYDGQDISYPLSAAHVWYICTHQLSQHNHLFLLISNSSLVLHSSTHYLFALISPLLAPLLSHLHIRCSYSGGKLHRELQSSWLRNTAGNNSQLFPYYSPYAPTVMIAKWRRNILNMCRKQYKLKQSIIWGWYKFMSCLSPVWSNTGMALTTVP